MDRDLEEFVWRRANGICEYCRMPQAVHPWPFQIDHIVAQQHHGETVPENLALSCLRCNSHKGPNLSGYDWETGEVVRLFHPRRDYFAIALVEGPAPWNTERHISICPERTLANERDDKTHPRRPHRAARGFAGRRARGGDGRRTSARNAGSAPA